MDELLKKLNSEQENDELIDMLRDQAKEIEALKEKADMYEVIRCEEIESCKKSLGGVWQEGYKILSIPTLRHLAKSHGYRK